MSLDTWASFEYLIADRWPDVDLPGTGSIFSFTVCAPPAGSGSGRGLPVRVGVVQLDGTQRAGARMLVNILDCDPESVKIGDKVEIVFEHAGNELSTPGSARSGTDRAPAIWRSNSDVARGARLGGCGRGFDYVG